MKRQFALGFVSLLVVGLCLATYITAIVPPLSYERSYPKGYSTGDGGPNDVVSIRPQVNGNEANFTITYDISEKLVVVNQSNVRNFSIYWDRAIEKVAGTDALDYYAALLFDIMYIRVEGTPGEKNITIYNVPKRVKYVSVDGDYIPFYTGPNWVKVTGDNGYYKIQFGSSSGVYVNPEIDSVSWVLKSSYERTVWIDLDKGWNLVSLPVLNLTSEDLFGQCECIGAIAYRGEDGSTHLIIRDSQEREELLLTGHGIYLYSMTDTAFPWKGDVIFSVSYTLHKGWNLLMTPYGYDESIVDVLNSNPHVDAIVSRDPSGQYDFYMRGTSRVDGLMEYPSGYYVYTKHDSVPMDLVV